MPDGTNVILVYDGSFEGLLSAVFETYAASLHPVAILPDGDVQQVWGADIRPVDTDGSHARRVADGVRQTMGRVAYEKIWTVYLSGEPAMGLAVLQYIRLGMQRGRSFHRMLTDPRVMAVNKQADLVTREAHALTQFARFSAVEGGVYYAAVHPQYRVLPLIVPHFFDRFRDQPFLLHDVTHGEVGVSDCREWVLAPDEGLVPPAEAGEEQAFRHMWKLFYDTVSIKQRYNPALRRQMMPEKYWKDMVEMQDVVVTRHGPAVSRR